MEALSSCSLWLIFSTTSVAISIFIIVGFFLITNQKSIHFSEDNIINILFLKNYTSALLTLTILFFLMSLFFNYVNGGLFFRNVKLFAKDGFCHLILQLTLWLIK